MSVLSNGQWAIVKYVRKYRQSLVIPFPVCAHAAIDYERRQLQNISQYKEWRQLRNKNDIKWNEK